MANLCKWKKDQYDKKFADLVEIVRKPKFACMKCGRVANSRKWLCKPKPLDE